MPVAPIATKNFGDTTVAFMVNVLFDLLTRLRGMLMRPASLVAAVVVLATSGAFAAQPLP